MYSIEPNNNIVTFNYDGTPISFNRGDAVMVNATEMAKPFGKLTKDFLKLQSTKEFLQVLSEGKKILSADLVKVTYGNNGGTWMHEDVAMEFARWLSPKFAKKTKKSVEKKVKKRRFARREKLNNLNLFCKSLCLSAKFNFRIAEVTHRIRIFYETDFPLYSFC